MNKETLIGFIDSNTKFYLKENPEDPTWENVSDSIEQSSGVQRWRAQRVPEKYGSRSAPTTTEIIVLNAGEANEEAFDVNNIAWEFKTKLYVKVKNQITQGNIRTANVGNINNEFENCKVTAFRIEQIEGVPKLVEKDYLASYNGTSIDFQEIYS